MLLLSPHKIFVRAGEVAQQLKKSASKSRNLSSAPQMHMVEERTKVHKLSSDLQILCGTYVHAQTHTYTTPREKKETDRQTESKQNP